MARRNVDERVAAGFGDEWSRFDQTELSSAAKRQIFDEYFAIFPWALIGSQAQGADFGCGSGRWATMVAPKVNRLYCVDASPAALDSARRNLLGFPNCVLMASSIDEAPIAPATLDFAYSLGVLHHVPDTKSALAKCVEKLKPGAPMLIYLYYDFDNRPRWYRWLWKPTEVVRRGVSRMPYGMRYLITQLIAVFVYWPLGMVARAATRVGLGKHSWPLSYYSDKPFYVMRTDALDRFGTRLEKRFSRREIEEMMRASGLERIAFSDRPPYWCAVGYREASSGVS